MVNRTMYAESAGITQVSLNVIYKLRVMKYEIPLTVMTYWNGIIGRRGHRVEAGIQYRKHLQ